MKRFVEATKVKLCLFGIAMGLSALYFSSTPAFDYTEPKTGYSLSKAMGLCKLIVFGEVTGKDFVYRDNVVSGNFRIITTDIAVTVDQVIKGKPNADDDTVKFMIRGGQGVKENGDKYWADVSTQPKFEIGEKVVVFLAVSDQPYYDHYPHNKYHVYMNHYGKRVVENGKVGIKFTLVSEETKIVELPIEVLVKFAKVFQLDKPSAIELENVIKEAAKASSDRRVSLTDEVIDTLKASADRVLRERTATAIENPAR